VKAIAKLLIAIVVVLLAVVVVIGPGRMVAGAEYPFGIGPWSSTGNYCHHIYEMTHFVDEWHHSDRATLSPTQRGTWLEFEKTLTKTGPEVPRADFTAWYRTSSVGSKKVSETGLINTWWNQNCTDPMMEAPAAVGHTWSGIVSHTSFTHYPKNVIHLANFSRRIPHTGQ
jgi:hypothetical protein